MNTQQQRDISKMIDLLRPYYGEVSQSAAYTVLQNVSGDISDLDDQEIVDIVEEAVYYSYEYPPGIYSYSIGLALEKFSYTNDVDALRKRLVEIRDDCRYWGTESATDLCKAATCQINSIEIG